MNNSSLMKLSYILLLFLMLSPVVFGQSVDERRAAEHQAVKDLLQQMGMQQAQAQQGAEKAPAKEDVWKAGGIKKVNAQADRKSFLMNGNKITTRLYNYGGVAPGYGLLRAVDNLVWKNSDYLFQSCPFVGAAVPDANDSTKRIHIISDALNDYPGLFEVSPTGDTLWQWQPLPGYADPDQSEMAANPAEDSDEDGKPDSWPRTWYNSTLGKYVWPGYLSQDATNADLETYWAMDDRWNQEFNYYPFEDDSTRKGIGIQIDGRAFQWSNALAENTIFFVYTITNVSDKDLDSVIFGIYGDPDIGGGSPENTDDFGYFVPPKSNDSVNVDHIPVYARSMTYYFDQDMEGVRNKPLGFLGCKFLESPGQPDDGEDNDDDGMIDERQDDGEDNDKDWDVTIHDVGIDGIPKTNDEGEGDGIPTAGLRQADGSPDPLYPGEPNFEFTDLDESDQIGLSSFNSWTWKAGGSIKDDESMWNRCRPGNYSDIRGNQDIVFIFSSGYINLKKGETKRISMAFLLGEDLTDLLLSAETVQRIYNENYQFFKPPTTPKLTAIPGDKKVTLFWDKAAESSLDPITGRDFEGYVLYRSTDESFSDIQVITDGLGSSFLSDPLKKLDGTECRWDIDLVDEPYTDLNGNGEWDSGEPYIDTNVDGKWTHSLESPWKGFHPLPYQGRGVHYYLGDNTGLQHTYVDSNNVINGQSYYYALVAYDHGDSVGIPPSETTKKISVDPISSELKFDDNTVKVIPGPRAAGYLPPAIGDDKVNHLYGIGTGELSFEIMDDLAVAEGGEYTLTFSDSLNYLGKMIEEKNYSLLNNIATSEEAKLYEDKFTSLSRGNISIDSYLKVTSSSGTEYTEGADFEIAYDRGAIRRVDGSSIPDESTVTVTYRNYPVKESTALDGEDTNPVFQGIHLRVYDEADLEINEEETGWIEGTSNLGWDMRLSQVLPTKEPYPADYRIEFSDHVIDTALTLHQGVAFIGVKYSVKYRDLHSDVYKRVLTFLSENIITRDSAFSLGEEITIFKPGSMGTATDTVTWAVGFGKHPDTTVATIFPTEGDVFFIKTKRPFTTDDKFILTTEAGEIAQDAGSSVLDNIYVVPNPYVGFNDIEPTNALANEIRGERRIYFENLPPECTIRIYNVAGDFINVIEHNSGMQNGREYWNLLNEDGFSISYGIYIAHIDAPGIGEKIVKFAVIK